MRAPPHHFLVRGETEPTGHDAPMDIHRTYPACCKEGILVFLQITGGEAFTPGVWRQVSFGGEYFRDSRQIALTHEDVQIAELAQLDRSVCHRGEHWTFECDRRN